MDYVKGLKIKPRAEVIKEFIENKEKARELINERLKFFNKFYDFNFKKISVKKQNSRWGSCSRKGNLNFNYKILFLPKNIADYIIVHELCHLKEFNHSPRFWALVAKTIPDYKKIRLSLKKEFNDKIF